VHDVLGDGFDLFHVAGKAAGVDDMPMPKFMRGCVRHAQFLTTLRIIVMGEILSAFAMATKDSNPILLSPENILAIWVGEIFVLRERSACDQPLLFISDRSQAGKFIFSIRQRDSIILAKPFGIYKNCLLTIYCQ